MFNANGDKDLTIDELWANKALLFGGQF